MAHSASAKERISEMVFVFVHGGAHGAWCWERVIAHLSSRAVALDLPGRGSRPAPLEETTLDDWVDAVVEEIAALAPEPVVLVGHSLAGIVLPRVAERAANRIAQMIFVSCSVPPEGQTVIDILSPGIRPLAEENLRNRQASVLPDEVARAMFCNDMDEEQTRFVLDRLVPEAWAPMLTPSRLAGLSLGIPLTYVKLLRDTAVPPALQDEIASHMGRVRRVELDAGHDAMISQPKALAALLEELAHP
jgi:pimeloyl-ACP methyl ester carboxylesterase